MCDCFHLAFPNWHAASSGTGAGRRLRGPEAATEDDSTCEEPSQFTEGERPRPQGSSPVEEFPESDKYGDSDKECEAEHDHKSGSGKKTKKSGLGSMFEKRSTPKMSKLKEVHSPESEVIVKTAKDGCAEGLVYGGGGREGIFIKQVVPESPASKSLKVKEGDQILSATVYFDNVTYEDAIQILEHAQAYKLKLCLKRKPDITETEPVIDSDVIPEEEVDTPEMREQGKTKRRGDARISWPKFPSFGKGRKSRFARSHSSSEADEQRKLELSPTTSDTESPIKSQDALKGKKKHKMKLSLTKRSRISSSEDQDTDAPTTGQTSSDVHQAGESDMLAAECLESPSGETPQVYLTEDLKVKEELKLEQSIPALTETQTAQHKVELISIDSTLKTTDLTVGLTNQESPTKSPDGKKKKKEKSEIKIKLLGKDKSQKKEAKAKSSPKRLKTLGASFEIVDQPENQKSAKPPQDQPALDVNTQMNVPKVELEASDVTFPQKSPKKGEEKTQKGKAKQKQETKSSTMFKLPKVGLSDISPEEIIQKTTANVEDCTTKVQQLPTKGAEVKEDPYEILSKSSVSRTQLPKREDIEIPGMEDVSRKTTAKGIKEPKAVYTGYHEEIHAETVQMSIDVDSVKEAVSKLPGFKLPKVDTSGVPIPEEITVIDANAQRISVKTPTKVVDNKAKHEVHFTKFEITASPEVSKTTVKLPKITPADFISEELLVATKVECKKTQKEHKTKTKRSDKDIKTEECKRDEIVIPGKESASGVFVIQTQETEGIQLEYESAATKDSEKKSKKAKITMPSFGIGKPDIRIPDIGIDLPKQRISEQKGDAVKEGTTVLQEEKMSQSETKEGKGQIGGFMCDVKIPEIDGIEYIDSTEGSPAKTDGGTRRTGFDVNLEAKPKADISLPEVKHEVKDVTIKLPKFEASVPDGDKDVNIDGVEIKTLERERKGSKFKVPNLGISMPKVKGPKVDLSLSKKDAEAKAEVQLPEVPGKDVTLGSVDVSIPEQKLEVQRSEVEIKPPELEGELDGQGSKFKMPKFGIQMPKITGPEFDLSLSQKDADADVKLPEAKAEVQLPEAPQTGVSLGSMNVSIPEQKIEVQKPELEGGLDGQGSKFKMPKLGIAMPKGKGPEFDLSLSKKDVDVALPEAKGKLLGVELKDSSAKIEIQAPEIEVVEKDAEDSPSKFKMASFKLPKFGAGISSPEVGSAVNAAVDLKTTGAEHEGKGSKFKMPHLGFSMPKVKGPKIDLGSPKKHIDTTLPEAEADVKLPDVNLEEADVSIPEVTMEVKKPELEMQTLQAEGQLDGQGGKFKMPKFGMSMPKVKGPEFHLGSSKKDVHVTTPEVKAGIYLPDTELETPSTKVEMKAPDIEIAAKDTEGSSSTFKMPNLSLSLPKVKGPDINLSLPKKETDITMPEVETEVKFPEASKRDVSLGKAEVVIPEAAVQVKKPEVQIKALQTEVELEGQGGKFKMPKFGITMPKVKGPEIDLSLSKKDAHAKLPEAKADVKLKEGPEVDVEIEGEFDGKRNKFKMPKLGIKMPKIKGPEFDVSMSKKDADAAVRLPEAPSTDVTLGSIDGSIPEARMEVIKPELEIKPAQTEGEMDGQGSKFKMPAFGMSVPKVKGPEVDFSLSKKDVDITLPEAKAEVSMPGAGIKEPSAKVDFKPADVEAQLGDVKGSPSKFKLPNFKFPKFGVTTPHISAEIPDSEKDIKIDAGDMHISDIDVTLPEAKPEVKLPDVELKKPSAEVEVKGPEIRVVKKEREGSPSKFKMPIFKLPKFGAGSPSVTAEVRDVDKGVKIDGGEIKVPEEVLSVTIEGPSIDTKGPSIDIKSTGTEHEGKGSKFKLPSLGFSMSQAKAPEIDLSVSKKDVDVTLPEAKGEIKVPDVELKKPSAEVEVKAPEIKVVKKEKEVSPSKFKMPTIKLPKFGVGIPSVTAEGPDVDKSFKIDGGDIKVPEEVLTVSVAAPSIDAKGPSIDIPSTGTELEGKEGKFKMPSLGFSGSQAKGPDIGLSLSKKDINASLPEAQAEVKLPDVELKKPSVEVEVKAPEIKVVKKEKEVSPSKFKMPTIKLPKFGVGIPSVTAEGPDVDKSFKIDGGDIKVPEEVLTVSVAAPSIDAKGPSIDIPSTGTELEGKEGKFKMPSLGFSGSQAKGPDIDLSLSKKDINASLPEAQAEVKLPDVELKKPSVEVGVKAPEIKVVKKEKEVSPSKFKMPTIKLPKFGVGIPSVTAEGPHVDKNVKLDGGDIKVPEEVLAVNVAAPSIDTKASSIDIKCTGTEHEGKESKFKLPSIGLSGSQVKGPGFDLSVSKKDVDVSLPEAEGEVKLPEVELKKPSVEVEIKAPEIKSGTKKTEVSPLKFKMPTFKLPKFGAGTPSVTAEGPDVDKSFKVDGAGTEVSEKVLSVTIAAPSIDTKGPTIDMKSTETEHEGKRSKFKMPSLGFSGSQVKGPDFDLSVSKKDVDVSLPEAEGEVKLPEVELKKPSVEVEIKAPEIKSGTKKTEVSPLKFKMPTFKLPKFGAGSPSVTAEGPDVNKSFKVDGADIEVPEEVLSVTIEGPSIDTKGPTIDIKSTGTEHEGKGSKFKMPSLGFSMSQAKAPEIDLSLSKKDVDVTLPEAKGEVKLPEVELKKPSAEVEVKASEIKVGTKETDGSPSKFKMPTLKLPKFGVGTSSVTVEGPDMDKDVKIDGGNIKVPEQVLAVNIAAPSIDTKAPSIDIKTSGTDHEGKGSKFKLPSLGFSMSQAKRSDIDFSLSKEDADVTLPEAKGEVKKSSAEMEVKGPEVKVGTKDTDGSPSKFKMPAFKLPKFGAGSPSVTAEVPNVDRGVKIDGGEIKVPEEVLSIIIEGPGIDTKVPSIDIKSTGTEHEGKGSKFKLPSLGFSMSQAKAPEIDLSVSKKDVDVTLPEAKGEIKVPDVELKKPSAEVEVKAPEIKVVKKEKEVSPSKFKMPTIKLPKFGVGVPSVTAEGPDMDKGVEIDGGDIKVPEEVLSVTVAAPSIDTKAPSIDIKSTGTEHEGKGSKFKLPSLGFSGSQAKRPDIDLSLSKKDVDVTLPESKAEVKKPSAEVEVKGPEIKVGTKDTDGSPSKFKMTAFKLPKFGVGSPSVTAEGPDMDKGVKIDGADMKVPQEVLAVKVSAPSIDVEGPSADIKTTGVVHEGKGIKFKMPSLGFSVSQAKGPDTDLGLSKKDVDVTLPDVKAEVKLPAVEVKEAEGAASAPDVKGPSWAFPRFSFSRPSGKTPDADVNLETPKGDIPSEAKAEISLPDAEVKGPFSTELPPAAESDTNLKKTRFSLPRFSFSKSSSKEPEVSAEVPQVDVCIAAGEVKVKHPEMEIKAPELEAEQSGQGSTFKLPKLGIGQLKAKGPEVDATVSEVKADIKLPDKNVKESSAGVEMKSSEVEAKSKDVGDSPLKFKMPTLKMKFGGASYDVTKEAANAEKAAEIEEAKLKEDVTVAMKSLSVDIKTDVPKAAASDPETPKTETDDVVLGSPNKFKLPIFKMPRLSFSKPKPEDEYIPVDSELKEDELKKEEEPKGESKSPKLSLTSFGEILKNIDVEFDVSKAEENLDGHEAEKLTEKQLAAKEKETNTKADTVKSPERTGWFKFPRFGLSSPSEPAKTSPESEQKDEEISPTFSVQSSDAFADVSSAVTSENLGPSLSPPTKVTVKYSGPDISDLGEIHSNIITSTARTELISVEPYLPEKITILSSGVSSSSEDTLRLDSGKIHVITSNIQGTPEAEHAKLLSAVETESAGGLLLKSEGNEAASKTVEESPSGKKSLFESLRRFSSETHESKQETVVITKQITHVFESSEPISGETASSIQRLRDSVHSEKMRFFDGAEK
ncbi:neuroblast differentiation-associated protein AHNAK-like isoform X2 [Acanthochromis polyacanthus]|uniref:neuroblast differentiation-associated protein AHNAK-like isoform X2 n=1 Tax=Acanthochromis polyacanthus TaxID=80966 RepID=UPI0022349BD5|nr:neuroblast differentiation-associated protein AHNAK-like isoform X2 [Acanthochromis polyacanthus]